MMLIAVGLVLIVAAACTASFPAPASAPAAPSIGDRLVVTYGAFDNMPLTADDATQAGWIDTGECVPQMGRHFIRMAGEQPSPLILLYNAKGALIGAELESLSEQPAPPWEHLEEGHPGMEFEHWTFHMYFDDPAKACEA